MSEKCAVLLKTFNILLKYVPEPKQGENFQTVRIIDLMRILQGEFRKRDPKTVSNLSAKQNELKEKLKSKIDEYKLNELVKDKNFLELTEDLIFNGIDPTDIINIVTEPNAVLSESKICIKGEVFKVLEKKVQIPNYMEKPY